LWFGAIGVLLALLFCSAARLPLDRDEGEYAWGADQLAGGALPYRNSFLQKPPGIVLVYLIACVPFGLNTDVLRGVLILAYLGTAILLHRLGRKVGGPRCGQVAALVFTLCLMAPLYESNAANTEAFMLLPLTGAMGSLWELRQRRADGPVTLAGLLFGLALFFKQIAVFHGIHLALSLLVLGQNWPERLRWLVLFGAGSVLPHGLAVGWFAAQGALGPYLDGVLLHNLEYVGGSLEPHGAGALWRRWAAFSLFDCVVWLGAVVALGLVLFQRRWWVGWFAGGWLLAAWAGVSSGGYYRGHYFIQALPPVCLLTGLLGDCLHRVPAPAFVPVLVGVWAATCPAGVALVLADAEQQSLARYETRRFLNAHEVGLWLRQSGGRSLFVLGSEPEIYHTSGLRGVSRYTIMNPLFGGFESSRARQQEVLDALHGDLPDYLVIAVPPNSVPLFPGSDGYLRDKVLVLVSRHYRLVAYACHDHIGMLEANGSERSQCDAVDLAIFRRAG
jgi:4-amino-4-deoxy-L-arabinose transferase-like glycosyltransferase